MAWRRRRHSNRCESEDGLSLLDVGSRAYYWNHGLCWLANDHVAVEGIDDDDMVPGVVIYDVNPISTAATPLTRPPAEISFARTSAHEVAAFAGPARTLFGSNNLLFSVTSDGVSIWTVHDGARVGILPRFSPQFHDRDAANSSSLVEDGVRTWHYQPD